MCPGEKCSRDPPIKHIGQKCISVRPAQVLPVYNRRTRLSHDGTLDEMYLDYMMEAFMNGDFSAFSKTDGLCLKHLINIY